MGFIGQNFQDLVLNYNLQAFKNCAQFLPAVFGSVCRGSGLGWLLRFQIQRFGKFEVRNFQVCYKNWKYSARDKV